MQTCAIVSYKETLNIYVAPSKTAKTTEETKEEKKNTTSSWLCKIITIVMWTLKFNINKSFKFETFWWFKKAYRTYVRQRKNQRTANMETLARSCQTIGAMSVIRAQIFNHVWALLVQIQWALIGFGITFFSFRAGGWEQNKTSNMLNSAECENNL